MDFGILLQAISYVAGYLFLIGLLLSLLLGWITFVVEMTQDRFLQGIIILLPIVVVLIILVYHKIAGL